MECFKCKEPIMFKKGVTNKWGKPQQLNLDGSEHWKTCSGRAQNQQAKAETSSMYKEVAPSTASIASAPQSTIIQIETLLLPMSKQIEGLENAFKLQSQQLMDIQNLLEVIAKKQGVDLNPA